MTATGAASATTRHIDRIIEVIDRALGIEGVTPPGPVLFDVPARPAAPPPSPGKGEDR